MRINTSRLCFMIPVRMRSWYNSTQMLLNLLGSRIGGSGTARRRRVFTVSGYMSSLFTWNGSPSSPGAGSAAPVCDQGTSLVGARRPGPARSNR